LQQRTYAPHGAGGALASRAEDGAAAIRAVQVEYLYFVVKMASNEVVFVQRAKPTVQPIIPFLRLQPCTIFVSLLKLIALSYLIIWQFFRTETVNATASLDRICDA
jgi:hypothetical protein